jgi:hypothetical protein
LGALPTLSRAWLCGSAGRSAGVCNRHRRSRDRRPDGHVQGAGSGTASTILGNGVTVGALVAVNALGSATIGDGRHFWSAPFEEDAEFGGLGLPHPFPNNARDLRIKFRGKQSETQNTTIAVIATDAVLTKAEAKRLAIAAHDGFSRALWPSHTPLDGDLVFALATGTSGKTVSVQDFIDLGAAAASTMARAIARGVHDATVAGKRSASRLGGANLDPARWQSGNIGCFAAKSGAIGRKNSWSPISCPCLSASPPPFSPPITPTLDRKCATSLLPVPTGSISTSWTAISSRTFRSARMSSSRSGRIHRPISTAI